MSYRIGIGFELTDPNYNMVDEHVQTPDQLIQAWWRGRPLKIIYRNAALAVACLTAVDDVYDVEDAWALYSHRRQVGTDHMPLAEAIAAILEDERM